MTVLNKHKDAIPAGAIYIGRGSMWGNPFVIGKDGNRDDVCDKHEQHLWHQIRVNEITLQELASLHNKPLVCFCAPHRCHGHTLEKAAAWAVERLGRTGDSRGQSTYF